MSKRRSVPAAGGKTRRMALTWTLLAVAVSACIAVGACALWLPDRSPQLLSGAKEVTTAPASLQEYNGSQQVTLVPTISAEQDLIGNASGTVTDDWSAGGLASGRGAYRVNDRSVVALNTAIPLYRDLKTGDTGDDVLALNNELNRLGYNSVPDSNIYWWATSDGWRQLMADNGNASDGSLQVTDTIWIPQPTVNVDAWTATKGSNVGGGTPVGKIPGTLTKLSIKNGTASSENRAISTLGVTGTLPANTIDMTDATFLQQVAASDAYRSLSQDERSNGIDASVALTAPMQTLRVPAGAIFGLNGSAGCIVPEAGQRKGRAVPVTIVGSELGVSLVTASGTDISAISTVRIGSGLNALRCR